MHVTRSRNKKKTKAELQRPVGVVSSAPFLLLYWRWRLASSFLPLSGRDWLSLFQGRGCRASAAAKSQPDWLMLFIKESMREWAWGGGPLCCCSLCRICARYLTPIYSYSDIAPRHHEASFFSLSASAAWQVEGAVISDWTQKKKVFGWRLMWWVLKYTGTNKEQIIKCSDTVTHAGPLD